MIIEMIVTVSVIYSFFLSYLFFISLKRINQYESLILKIQQIIEFSTEKMKMVDVSGHYSADDETGFFFNQLKEVQLLLDNIFETENEE
tara:strand:- start:251 stop:517 length:267 start_codon:yes stop_codon:yes gene_type:complete